MEKTKKIKIYTMDELTDKYIGKRGDKRRDKFECDLKQKMQLHKSRKRLIFK